MDGLAVLGWGLNAFGWFFIAYSVLINTSFLALTLLAVADFWAYLRRVDFAAYDETFAEPVTPGISILMPAYNESAGIVESVQAMTALRYPDFEVVVIDDGSKDDTSEQLVAAFDMVEVPIVVPTDIATKGHVTATYLSRRGANNVLLVRKTNGGKADALNVGINAARKQLVCMVDADSLLDPDALLHVSRPFADDPDRVLASGGVVRVANGSQISRGRVDPGPDAAPVAAADPGGGVPPRVPRRPHRLVAARRAADHLRGVRRVPQGRAARARRPGHRLHRRGRRAGGPAAPLDRRPRRRRPGGLRGRAGGLDGGAGGPGGAPQAAPPLAPRPHRDPVQAQGHGASGRATASSGMVSMPWFVAFELLAPFVEVFGVAFLAVALVLMSADALGLTHLQLVNQDVVWVLLATSLLYAVVLTLAALVIEELSFRRYRGLRDLAIAVWASLEENIGYRQVNAWWRMGGSLEAWRGTKHDWGDMQRRGLGKT